MTVRFQEPLTAEFSNHIGEPNVSFIPNTYPETFQQQFEDATMMTANNVITPNSDPPVITGDLMDTHKDAKTYVSGDLDYIGSTGASMGIHTAGFRRSKYTPQEWHESNYAKYYNSFDARDKAEGSRQISDKTMKEAEKRTFETQKTTTKKLAERLHDTQFWKFELEREIQDMIKEQDDLKAQKVRMEVSLRSTEIPLHIASDNLNCRRRRQGLDMVEDDVELSLLKEVEIINNAQDLLRKTVEQAERQMRANWDAKTRLEMDWSDKKEAHELDTAAGSLTNESTAKMLHAGTAVFQQVQSTPESWAQFSHDNILLAEHERMGSIQLRTLVDNLLEDISRDMQEQYDAVNRCFHKRLDEVEQAKAKLEENLRNICDDIGKEEMKIKDLKKHIKDKENPLKVATTRLHIRENRPGVDMCRDDTQYQLIGEVHEIQQSLEGLERDLSNSESHLKVLMDNRMELEREISNKKNTLFIDREKCLTHRSRYPNTLKLQGYNK